MAWEGEGLFRLPLSNFRINGRIDVREAAIESSQRVDFEAVFTSPMHDIFHKADVQGRYDPMSFESKRRRA